MRSLGTSAEASLARLACDQGPWPPPAASRPRLRARPWSLTPSLKALQELCPCSSHLPPPLQVRWFEGRSHTGKLWPLPASSSHFGPPVIMRLFVGKDIQPWVELGSAAAGGSAWVAVKRGCIVALSLSSYPAPRLADTAWAHVQARCAHRLPGRFQRTCSWPLQRLQTRHPRPHHPCRPCPPSQQHSLLLPLPGLPRHPLVQPEHQRRHPRQQYPPPRPRLRQALQPWRLASGQRRQPA